MAKFRLTKAHNMCKEDLRDAAQGLAASLERKHGVRARWESDDEVCIKGAGVEGRLLIDEDKVDVSVQLGLLASAFAGTLKKEVQRYLDEYIA